MDYHHLTKILLLLLMLFNVPRISCDDDDDDDDDSSGGDGCHPHRAVTTRRISKHEESDFALREVTIRCNRDNVVFEVRYNDSSLCTCGRLAKASSKVFPCTKMLSGKPLTLLVSVHRSLKKNEMCNFTLLYTNVDSNERQQVKVKMPLAYNPDPSDSTAVSTTTIFASSMILSTSILTKVIKPKTSGRTTIIQTSFTSNAPTSSNIIQPTSSLQTSLTSSASTSSNVIQPTSSSFVVKSSSFNKPVMSSSVRPSSTIPVVSSSSVLSEAEREKKFKKDVMIINEVNTSNIDINDEKTISRVLDAATNLIESNRTNKSDQGVGMDALNTLERMGQSLARQLVLGNQSEVTFQQATAELIFGAAVVNTTISSGLTFPQPESNNVGNERIEMIDIPRSAFASSSSKQEDIAYFVGIVFNGLTEMKTETADGFMIGSRVINAKILPDPPEHLSEPIEMMFEKFLNGSQQDCSFWVEDSLSSGDHDRWSTRGCSQSFQNETHIRCSCSHLTNFAVLFQVTNDQNISEEDTFRLQIITYIGLSLSILGCFLTFVIYVSLRNIKSDRATIHTNLVLALGIADIIFLVTIAIKPVKDNCLVVAMLAFYFYLAVFFWMFVEGIYIYLMIIKVFRGNVRRRRRIAYVVGWGCPVIIAVVTWAILRDDVISKYHCWLSVESGAIWAFVGPALFIILVNLIILIATMRTTWATFVDDKEYTGLKSATKTFGAVIPILGITWVFGVMAFNESSLVFQYIFAITNSIQGVIIFILYCLVNSEVRSELRHKYNIWQTRREVTSSSAGRRPTYVISSEKNTTFNQTTPSAAEQQVATPKTAQRPLVEAGPDATVIVARDYAFEQQLDKEGFELNGHNGGQQLTNGKENLNEEFGVGYV